MKRYLMPIVATVAAFTLEGAVSDFTRTVVSTKLNGWDGVQFIKWTKTKSSSNCGRGWAVKVDLSKGYRLRTQLGDADGNKARVGTMAETIFNAEGVAPIMGMNADYFDVNVAYAKPTGLVITDDKLATAGWPNNAAPEMCYIMQTADNNFIHSKLVRNPALPSGYPSASWQVSAANGKKIRQAVRTNYCNYPVKGGVMNPVANPISSGGATFPTTIGNMQSRTAYPRPLIGIGTNAVGVATNLVLFINDGRQTDWSYNFPDVDAYQIMIDEGCNEVGEFDGGGSAAMWMAFGADSEYNFGTTYQTAHGNYVNKPSDGSPRNDACGIFLMPPANVTYTAEVNDGNLYADANAPFTADAIAPGDTIKARTATPLALTSIDKNLSFTSTATDPSTAPFVSGSAITVAAGTTVNLANAAFAPASGTCTITVAAGGKVNVSGKVALGKIAVPTPSEIVVNGTLTGDLVVDCATAPHPGDVFATTTLPLAQAQASAAHLKHPTVANLVGTAVNVDGVVKLKWTDDIVVDTPVTSDGYDFTNGVVTVNVTEIGSHIATGSKLHFTVKDANGNVVANGDKALNGTGAYVFDTAEYASAATALAENVNYTYSVQLVDAGGTAVETAQQTTGSLHLGSDSSWFASAADDDSATGGTWTTKPEIENGYFVLTNGGEYAFSATDRHGGVVRVSSYHNVLGGFSAAQEERMLADFTANPPQGAMGIFENSDASLSFRGLVKDNGVPAWRTLFGVTPVEKRIYRLEQEVDMEGGTPRISYLAAEGEAEPVRLADESGETWFTGTGASANQIGIVEFRGNGEIAALAGEFASKAVAEVDGVRYASLAEALAAATNKQVRLLTNVTLTPSAGGTWSIAGGDFRILLNPSENGSTATYENGTLTIEVGSLKFPVSSETSAAGTVMATVTREFILEHLPTADLNTAAGLDAVKTALNAERTDGNGLPLIISYILGLDPNDPADKPNTGIVAANGGFTLSLGDNVSVNPDAEVDVKYSLKSADNLKFENAEETEPSSSSVFNVTKPADTATNRFFRVIIHLGQ